MIFVLKYINYKYCHLFYIYSCPLNNSLKRKVLTFFEGRTPLTVLLRTEYVD